MTTGTVILFSRDPGATNMLVALHDLITRADATPKEVAANALADLFGTRPAVFAKSYALRTWADAGIAARKWPATADDEKTIRQILEAYQPKAVVTGTTDIDDNTDQAFWAICAEQGIPTHAFLDHPANLIRRFTTPDGRRVFPNRIHAPNDHLREMLIAEGGPADRIDVVGELHLARLQGAPLDTAAPGDRTRARWGAGSGATVMLFASECGREMAEQGRPSAYDEIAVLERFLADLAAGAPLGGRRFAAADVLVVIRPHPRDVPGKYDRYLRTAQPRVIVSDEETPRDAITAADMVVGMDSTMLREAEALGVPALSLLEAQHQTMAARQ